MALDTRLIGQATGGGRPLNLAGAVRPAIMRGEQAFARAAAKKAAYQKAIKEREEFSAKLIEQFKIPSFKGVPNQAMGWLTEQLGTVKNNVYSIATNKNLTPTQQQILINEEKSKVNDLTYWANEYKESMKDFVDKTDMLSQVNTENDLLLDQKRIAGEYEIKGDEAIFNINNVEIKKPISELSKGFNLIEQDHIAYNNLLEKVNNVAKKTAAQGKDETALNYEIKNGLQNLNLTDMQLLSLGVDRLGFSGVDMDTIRKEAKDENPDKIDNIELKNKIINFIELELTKGAKEAYSAYFNPIEPKDPTQSEIDQNKILKIGTDIAENVTKNPVEALKNVTDAPIKYNKINKIIEIEQGVDKDGEALPKIKFNLNNKSDYIRYIDLILTNETLTGAQRAKAKIAAKNWVDSREGMFKTENSEITSDDLLGLPKFEN
tara:strand:- start:331 stop:1632 length:1302 start_codon:yes stop_codon:yes gene_type:complete